MARGWAARRWAARRLIGAANACHRLAGRLVRLAARLQRGPRR